MNLNCILTIIYYSIINRYSQFIVTFKFNDELHIKKKTTV